MQILAWYPQTFITEFLQLLPAFLSDQTVSEVCHIDGHVMSPSVCMLLTQVLHSVLDLPCLAAVLQLQYYSTLGEVLMMM